MVSGGAAPSAQEAWFLAAGAHDTIRSIATVLRTAPKVERPALARILSYELDRHERFVKALPFGELDDALKEAIRLTQDLVLLEVGSGRFEEIRAGIAKALEHHIEDEEIRMRQVA